MPVEFVQGNPLYRAQIPRSHDDNCDQGIERFPTVPLPGGVTRRFLIEIYGITVDEMCERQDPMNEHISYIRKILISATAQRRELPFGIARNAIRTSPAP
jgi:hypothetical protein